MLSSLTTFLTLSVWSTVVLVGRAQPLDSTRDAHTNPVARGLHDSLPERSVTWIMDRAGNTPQYQTDVGPAYPTHSMLLFEATAKDAAFAIELADNTDTLTADAMDHGAHRVAIRVRADPTIPSPKDGIRAIFQLERKVRLRNDDLVHMKTGKGILFDVWRSSAQIGAPASTLFTNEREDNLFVYRVLTHPRLFGQQFQAPDDAMILLAGAVRWSQNTFAIRAQQPIEWIFYELEPELPSRPTYNRRTFRLANANSPTKDATSSPLRPESFPAWSSAYHPYEKEIMHIEPLPSFTYATQGERLHGAPAAAPNRMPMAAPMAAPEAAANAAAWAHTKRKGGPDAPAPVPLRAKMGAWVRNRLSSVGSPPVPP